MRLLTIGLLLGISLLAACTSDKKGEEKTQTTADFKELPFGVTGQKDADVNPQPALEAALEEMHASNLQNMTKEDRRFVYGLMDMDGDGDGDAFTAYIGKEDKGFYDLNLFEALPTGAYQLKYKLGNGMLPVFAGFAEGHQWMPIYVQQNKGKFMAHSAIQGDYGPDMEMDVKQDKRVTAVITNPKKGEQFFAAAKAAVAVPAKGIIRLIDNSYLEFEDCNTSERMPLVNSEDEGYSKALDLLTEAAGVYIEGEGFFVKRKNIPGNNQYRQMFQPTKVTKFSKASACPGK